MLLLLFFLFEGLIFFLVSQMFSPLSINLEITSTIIMSVNSVIFLFFISKISSSKSEFIILFLAYFIRILILYWDVFGRDIFILPNSGLDSEMYHENAVQFSQYGDSGRGGTYSEVIGYIYILFGEQRIIAQYFNLLLSISTIILVLKIMNQLKVPKKILLVILTLIAFLPNYIVMSTILLRESIIIYLVTLSLYFFLKWWDKQNFYHFSLSILIPIIASFFHSGAMAVSIGYVLCFIFYNKVSNKFKFNVTTIISAAFFIIVFMSINFILGDIIFAKFSGVESVEDILNATEAYTTGGAAYLQFMDPNNLVHIILFTPIRVFYFLGSPFPWDWRGFQDIFAFVFSGMFYISCIYYAYIALRIKDNPYKTLLVALIIIAISTTLFFAWGVSNSGTALRHREKFLGVYLMILGVSLSSIYLKEEFRKIQSLKNL